MKYSPNNITKAIFKALGHKKTRLLVFTAAFGCIGLGQLTSTVYAGESVVVSLNREDVFISKFETGVTYTHDTFNHGSDASAIELSKKHIFDSSQFVNQHLMGFGPGNPNPSDGVYNWSDLDKIMGKHLDGGKTVVLTACCSPSWMKGGAADFKEGLEVAPNEENYEDYADLVAKAVKRYPQIEYVQVWNEMKGFFDSKKNRWNYEGYTELYNLTYKKVKAVRPSVKIGGPYVVTTSNGKDSFYYNSDVGGEWGKFDKRDLAVVTYWLKNKIGADFITIDAKNSNKDKIEKVDLFERDDKFGVLYDWIRNLDNAEYPGAASLPIWWGEWYARGESKTDSNDKLNAVMSSALIKTIKTGSETALIWGTEGDAAGKYHPLALTTGTDKPGGGKPTEYYDTQKAVNNHFSKGTQLYSVDTSSDSVNVLAAKNKTMLVNKTQSDLTVVLEGTSYNLDDYEVRVIDTPASKSPKIVEAKPDANAPKVSIIGLNNGATLNGKVQFRADATDDAGVAKVEFFVDDENKHTDTTKPYVRTHDVSTLIDGSHTLYAVATDTSGNKKQSETVQFTVVDGIDVTAPSAKVTFPTNGRAVIGNIRLRADASDNRRVAKVDFYIDGEIKHTDTTSPYVRQHDTSTLTNGHHTVYVVATDDSGNIIKTAKKYFVVSGGIDETPPETRITNLKNGSVVSGNIQFKATASDDVSLAKVQFFLDGKDTHTDRTSPFVRSHSTKELSNGKHTLYTVATDTSGNKTKSASVTFTVRN